MGKKTASIRAPILEQSRGPLEGKGRRLWIERMMIVPEDEGDLVPLTAVDLELVVEDGIAAVPLGELRLEVLVGGVGATDVLDDHLGVGGVHLEGDITVLVAELELVELLDAIVRDSNAGHVDG